MTTIKKFNQMNESTEYNGITIKEFFGDIVEDKQGVILTSNGIYVRLSKNDIDRWSNWKIKLDNTYTSQKNIYSVLVDENGNGRYLMDFAYVLFKDNKPFIFCTIPGDDRGATTFNNTFIVSGHDGSYLFNTFNPFETKRL